MDTYRPGMTDPAWTRPHTGTDEMWDEFDEQPDSGVVPFAYWMDEIRRLAVSKFGYQDGFQPAPNVWRPYYDEMMTPFEALRKDENIINHE